MMVSSVEDAQMRKWWGNMHLVAQVSPVIPPTLLSLDHLYHKEALLTSEALLHLERQPARALNTTNRSRYLFLHGVISAIHRQGSGRASPITFR